MLYLAYALPSFEEYVKYEKKLKNTKFLSNAPKEVVEEVREKANNILEKINSIHHNLKNITL